VIGRFSHVPKNSRFITSGWRVQDVPWFLGTSKIRIVPQTQQKSHKE
jgi:hypothetical protein